MSFPSTEMSLGGLSLNNFAFNFQPRRQVVPVSLPRLFTQLPPSTVGPHHRYQPYAPQHGGKWRMHTSSYKPSYYPTRPTMHFPSSPSDSISSTELSPIQSTSSSPSLELPRPSQGIYVQCTAPLIAPKPLPYHSPQFLQFEELPELDEDLSHAPYVRRPQKKRKRENEPTSSDSGDVQPSKRRTRSSTASSKAAARPMPPQSRSRQPPAYSTRRSQV